MGIFQRFWSGREGRTGNVAIIFAIAIVPVIGGVGAAVDYAMANSNRSSMQKALDSTALALAKLMPLDQAQLDARGWEIFSASLGHLKVDLPQSGLVITTPSTGKILLAATGHYTPQIANLVGIQSFPVHAQTEVQWGIKKLELSLVLDVTGSMDQQGRMTELKKATKNLLTTLKNAAKQPDDVKVAIVPFAGQVNVDRPTNQNATWLDWTDWEAEPAYMATWLANATNLQTWEQTGPGSACPLAENPHGYRCLATPTSGANASNIPSNGTYRGYICPGYVNNQGVNTGDTGRRNSTWIGRRYNGCYDSVQSTREVSSGSNASCNNRPNCTCSGNGSNRKCNQTYFQHTWLKNARSTWDGCVRDRAKDNDDNDTAPTTAATNFQPYQNYYCPPALLPLTNDWNALNSKVDALAPLGATNITVGLVWGLHSLTASQPMTQTNTSDPQLTRAIILMTDGDNTISRWAGNGSDPNQCTDCDARTTMACNSVKAANIRLYTVRMIDGNATLLRNCATNTTMYFDVQNASQLNAVFNAIGGELASLHLSQ
jgi:Flp pilus assembly protein TadG